MNKFVATIRCHPEDFPFFQRVQLQYDAPDVEVACLMGNTIKRKMEEERGLSLQARIRWAPELEGEQGLN